MAGHGATRYIRLNGALSDQGIRKLFSPGPTSFTFPLGVSGKYTPVTYNITANTALSTSYITLKPINLKHPATYENPAAINELQYYWNAVSSGFSGLNVNHTYQYINSDAIPNETNYVVGRYDMPTYTWNVPATSAMNAGADNFTISNVNYIDGEYTCGVNIAPSPNFTNLPVYYSRNATLGGNWNNPTSWTLNADGSGGPAPSFPQGNPVVILPGHTITMNIDNAKAYSVDIDGTFDLAMTRYHNLGHIAGGGTLRIAANAVPNDNFLFPGGYYDVFMTTPGSIVDFYGINSGSLPLKPGNIYKPFQNVLFTGNSTKRMSSENMKVLNDLTIRNGSILSNILYNKNIYLLGDWRNENAVAGGFMAGLGLVSLDGTLPQDVNIVNNIVETFYDLRIANPSGASITTGLGDVDVTRYLYLTSGNISTDSDNSLTINNTSTSAIKGGSASSFVNGPLRKRILNSSSFNFPVGKTSPRNRFGNVEVLNTNTSGVQLWTGEYFDANPHPVYDTSMRVDPLSQVSGSEYWNIIGPAGGRANVRLRWDNLSELVLSTPASRQKLRVAEFLPAGWTSVGQLITDNGIASGTIETTTPVLLDNHIFTIGISSVPTVRITSATSVSICNDGSQAIIDLVFTDPVNAPFDFAYTINGGSLQYVYNVGSTYSLIFDGATLGGTGSYAILVTDVWDNTGAQGIVRSPSQVDITVLPTPVFDITGALSAGTNTTTSYSTTATSTDSYLWTLDNGLGTVNNNTTRTPTIDWGGSAGSSRLTVLKTNANGCFASGYVDIAISLSPQPEITGLASVCAGTTQTYSVTPNAGHTYLWTVSSGGTIQGSNTGSSVSILWGSAATGENVSITETFGGFPGTDILPVDIGFVPQSSRTVIVDPASICGGGSSTITIQNSENNVAYQLRNNADDSPVGSYVGGTGGSIDIIVTPAATTTYNILAYTNAPFGCQVELNGTYTVTVNPLPAAAGVITGTATVCQGQSAVAYSVPVIANATSYAWNYSGTGATITGGTTRSITIDFAANATLGNLTVQGVNACGNGTVSANYAIAVNPLPAAAGVITGTATVCQGQSAVAYSVPVIANATSYAWNYSGTGATITGGTTRNITIDFAANATLGNLTVQGVNACGNGTVSANYAIAVNPLPAAAGVITGTATVCQGQSAVAYSVPVIANATSYAWNYSGTGATITGGTTRNITIDFAANATLGNLTVQGVNACGNGTVSANYAIAVNPLPAAAGVITGTATVCQGQSAVAYSVPVIANATSYAWNYSGTGATITGGTTRSITIDFAANATLGNLTVHGVNACGNGTVSANYAIAVNPLPAAAGVITGTATVCQGQSAVAYSVPVIANATSYAWNYSGTGATITGGTTRSITIDFAANATLGNLTVNGVNACGNGTVSANYAIAVNPLPAAAGVITGTATVCQGQSAVAYSVPVIANATSYAWNYSGTGATITGGTTRSITIDFAANATLGNLTVNGVNACGNGTVSANYAIAVNPLPAAAGVITGTATVCQGQSAVAYSVPVIANATSYAWNYSGTGATITGGTTRSITIDFAANATLGNLTVQGVNACGNGTVSANYAIAVNPLPAAAGVITGTATVCQGQSAVAYSVPVIANATSYAWNYSGTGATITGGTTRSITIDFAANATLGNLTVNGVNACGNGTVSANYAIAVNPLPAAAGVITGTATVCQGQSAVAYSVPVIANATSYAWNYSGTGATITGGTTRNITIDFAANATLGNLTVQGVNACGNGTVSANYAIAVNPLPAAAGVITGTATVCQGQSAVAYSVPVIANATSYAWNYSGTGATITGGTTRSITINFAANATLGNLTVYGVNACGNGTVSANYAITVNVSVGTPIFILGATSTRCMEAGSVTYTATATDNTGITYSLDGASETGGNTINSINR